MRRLHVRVDQSQRRVAARVQGAHRGVHDHATPRAPPRRLPRRLNWIAEDGKGVDVLPEERIRGKPLPDLLARARLPGRQGSAHVQAVGRRGHAREPPRGQPGDRRPGARGVGGERVELGQGQVLPISRGGGVRECEECVTDFRGVALSDAEKDLARGSGGLYGVR